MNERRFVLTIIEDDIDARFKADLEDHVREAIGEAFDLDADVSFGVEEDE